MMLSHDLDAKRLELLHEVLPSAKRIAVLRYPPPRHDTTFAKLGVAADRLGLILHGVTADAPSAYLPALHSARQAGVDALLVASSPDFARDAAIIAKAATAAGLPTVCEWDFMARDGCLIGYGPLNAELRRRTGVHVAQILRGIPAGDIPIEGPTSFALSLNLRTAQAVGIDFQPAILARADEVIE
jgi:putative ABC transport system substrate-binding protein